MELRIQEIHIDTTYGSFIEGTTEGINMMLMRGLSERIRRRYFFFQEQMFAAVAARGGKKVPKKFPFPVHLPTPSSDEMLRPFPSYFCVAVLCGPPVENKTLSIDTLCSRVYCVWFTDDIEMSVTEIVRNGVRPFDWDAIAENCEL